MNVSLYEADTRRGEDLCNLLISAGGGGGQSVALLTECVKKAVGEEEFNAKQVETLIFPSKSGHVKSYEVFCERIVEAVQTYPLLLSECKIEEAFLSEDNISFSGEPTSDFTDETYSMVIIGARRIENKLGPPHEYLFLLQNSHCSKFFVECSAEYLQICKAKVTFIMHITINSFPSSLPLITEGGDFFETCIAEEETRTPEIND